MPGAGRGITPYTSPPTGPQVLGIDVAETAVSIAREHAATRELDVEFIVGDALQLATLGRVFDTVLDWRCFTPSTTTSESSTSQAWKQ